MKILGITSFILFLFLTVYVLLTKKIPSGKFPQKLSPPSTSKIIGEKKTVNLPAYELQRQRMDEETVFTFESKKSGEIYELDEEELDSFNKSLGDLKQVNRFDQNELIRIDTPVNTEERYYEVQGNDLDN